MLWAISLPNPAKWIGDKLSSAAGWAWDKVVSGIFNWIASGLVELMEWVWDVLDTASTPRVTEAWFADELMTPIALFGAGIVLIVMLAQAMQAALAGRPELIVDAVKQAFRALIAAALTVTVVDMMIEGADALSDAVWDAGRPDMVNAIEKAGMVLASPGPLGAMFIAPFVMFLGIIGMLLVVTMLFMRSSMIYLVVAFSPITWSIGAHHMFRDAGRKLVHMVVALVLAKPAIVITMRTATTLLNNIGNIDADHVEEDFVGGLGVLVTAFSMYLIAGLSPWVVYKLLPTVENAVMTSGVAGGWGRMGMAAAGAAVTAKTLGAGGLASAATRPVTGEGAMTGAGMATSSPRGEWGVADSSGAGDQDASRPVEGQTQ